MNYHAQVIGITEDLDSFMVMIAEVLGIAATDLTYSTQKVSCSLLEW